MTKVDVSNLLTWKCHEDLSLLASANDHLTIFLVSRLSSIVARQCQSLHSQPKNHVGSQSSATNQGTASSVTVSQWATRRLTLYTCFSWKSGKECCYSQIMLTSSWFKSIGRWRFCQFNIDDAYLFTLVSGMDSAVPLTGRPYGGCCSGMCLTLSNCL